MTHNEIKLTHMEKLAEYRKNLYENPRLVTLFFELTDACNMNCLHCGSHASPKNKRFLDTGLVKKVLDEVANEYDTENILVCFSGGEPLLHPDFLELISYASNKGFCAGMTSNGTLITEEIAKKLADAGLKSVSISIDGTKESHDWFRGQKGAYDRAITGIKNLLKTNEIYTQITTVIHKKNIDMLDDIYGEVVKSGVHSWRPIGIDPIGRALEHKDLILDGNDNKKLIQYIQSMRQNKDVKIDVTYGCSHYLGVNYEHTVRDFYYLCVAGIMNASILCNGDIYGCMDIERRKELIAGNVYKDSFIDVWKNGFKQYRQNKAYLCSECDACSDKEFCCGEASHTWDYNKNEPMICMKKYLDD